jgi:hypothetical protein
MLDRGVPVHVVAARIGGDPATLLRWSAKRTKNRSAAAVDWSADEKNFGLGRDWDHPLV